MPFGLQKAKRVNDSANIERQYYDRDFSHTFEMTSMRKAQAMKQKKRGTQTGASLIYNQLLITC